jgi:hypothetical protein
MKNKIALAIVMLLELAATVASPLGAEAASITSRSVTLGTSAPSVLGTDSTTYTFSFKPATSGAVGSVKFQICDSPIVTGACNQPSGASFSSPGASLNAGGSTAPFNSGWANGSGGQAATSTTFWITNGSTPALTAGNSYSIQLQGVHNPTAVNYQFFARLYTYSDAAGTNPVDSGGMAISTAQQITVSGVMPESLIFCVGTSGSNCGNITGSAVDLGTFSPTSTNTGLSVMSASTNASFGYAITVNGTTLTSGSNTIAAMGTQSANSAGCAPSCTSTTGVAQFGSNVRQNTVPAVGADVSGLGSALGFGGYNTPNGFRFFTGDTVASAAGVTKANLFTNSYIVNVGGDQAAGVYTSTLTYICTATF